MTIGSVSIDDGDGSEKVTFKMNSRFFNFVAFIPVHCKCEMWANFLGVDLLATGLKLRLRSRLFTFLLIVK